MMKLLLLKEQIVKVYNRNEVFITPIIKTLIALIVISVINVQLGYLSVLNNMLIVMMAALMCSFMPYSFITAMAAIFALGHFYALGIEAAGFAMVGFLLVYLLLVRFVAKEKIIVVILPILMALKIPYFIPVVLGLIGTPFSIVSVSCGVIVYYIALNISNNAQILASLNSDDAIQKVKILVDTILNDKAMIITIIALSATVIVVYTIRRLAIDNCWTIAMCAGYAINLMVLVTGDLAYKTDISIVVVIIMSIVSFVITKIVEFFIFNIDYSRVEKVQFEDDDYYYYVKAVPKIKLNETNKKVKKINSVRRK